MNSKIRKPRGERNVTVDGDDLQEFFDCFKFNDNVPYFSQASVPRLFPKRVILPLAVATYPGAIPDVTIAIASVVCLLQINPASYFNVNEEHHQ